MSSHDFYAAAVRGFGDLHYNLGDLLRIPQSNCDVAQSDDAHDTILLVHHWDAPSLMPFHQIQRMLDIIFGMTGEYLRRHYIPDARTCGITSLGDDPHSEIPSVTIPTSRFVSWLSHMITAPTFRSRINCAARCALSARHAAERIFSHDVPTSFLHTVPAEHICHHTARRARIRAADSFMRAGGARARHTQRTWTLNCTHKTSTRAPM
jgi:hypothetical protein